MIAKFVFFASALTLASCATKEVQLRQNLEGVDPNSLSCDPRGEVFLLLPHFTNCNKFYMCAHGKEVEMACASSDLIFDFVLQTCNWRWATTCVLRESRVESEEEEEEEGSGDISLEIPDAVSAIELVKPSPFGFAVVDCESPVTASRQVPYRGDCQRFWRCANGIPQASFCSDGLFFNPKNEQCDFEANVQCLDNVEELEDGFLVA